MEVDRAEWAGKSMNSLGATCANRIPLKLYVESPEGPPKGHLPMRHIHGTSTHFSSAPSSPCPLSTGTTGHKSTPGNYLPNIERCCECARGVRQINWWKANLLAIKGNSWSETG